MRENIDKAGDLPRNVTSDNGATDFHYYLRYYGHQCTLQPYRNEERMEIVCTLGHTHVEYFMRNAFQASFGKYILAVTRTWTAMQMAIECANVYFRHLPWTL